MEGTKNSKRKGLKNTSFSSYSPLLPFFKLLLFLLFIVSTFFLFSSPLLFSSLLTLPHLLPLPSRHSPHAPNSGFFYCNPSHRCNLGTVQLLLQCLLALVAPKPLATCPSNFNPWKARLNPNFFQVRATREEKGH